MPDSVESLNEAIAYIEKKLGQKVYKGDAPELELIRVPIGIVQLDELLGGGFPRGRITVLAGHYSSCKTFVCQELIKAIQLGGGNAVLVDAERTYDEDWFAKTGVNVSELYVVQPDTGEHAFDAVEAFLRAGVDLVILDSIAALSPSYEQDEQTEKNTMGALARLVNKGIRKMLAANNHRNTIIVLINQLRDSMSSYGLGEVLPGGKGQEDQAAVILKFRRGAKIEENAVGGKRTIGTMVSVFQQKNKVGGIPLQGIELPFLFEGYIDNFIGIIDIAKTLGIIKQRGPSYNLYGLKYIGRIKLKEALQNDQELFDRLRADIASGNFAPIDEIPPSDES